MTWDEFIRFSPDTNSDRFRDPVPLRGRVRGCPSPLVSDPLFVRLMVWHPVILLSAQVFRPLFMLFSGSDIFSVFICVQAVLRIHDILVWIRILIWIRGSISLTNGFGSGCGYGSCYFRHWTSRCENKKLYFCHRFLLITFSRCIYIIFKDKKSKRSHKAVGIKVFLLFLIGDRSNMSTLACYGIPFTFNV